jgi:glycosyltransferase involved in cell wall biosynthesis
MGVRRSIEVISVGSNIPLTPITEIDREGIRRGLMEDSNALLVAAFGSVHDRDLTATQHAIRQLDQRAELVWIGGSRAESSSQRAWAGSQGEVGVRWTGHLPHQEVSRLLGACDLMILPFIDGVSTRRTSAITGLQHGVPLLTTRGAKLEDCFIHGQNLYLVPARDRRALAQGLSQLAGNPDLRSHIARGARRLYETHFAWDVVAEQVSNVVRGGPPQRDLQDTGNASVEPSPLVSKAAPGP